jgi:hypothetical protein
MKHQHGLPPRSTPTERDVATLNAANAPANRAGPCNRRNLGVPPAAVANASSVDGELQAKERRVGFGLSWPERDVLTVDPAHRHHFLQDKKPAFRGDKPGKPLYRFGRLGPFPKAADGGDDDPS